MPEESKTLTDEEVDELKELLDAFKNAVTIGGLSDLPNGTDVADVRIEVFVNNRSYKVGLAELLANVFIPQTLPTPVVSVSKKPDYLVGYSSEGESMVVPVEIILS